MPSLQILQGPEDVSKQMDNQIMGTLGQGLGNFMTHRNANKALESVLNDPNLKAAPVSERLDRLTRALSPYGEVGQSVLSARLGVEQQARQENQDSLNQKILSKHLSGKPISEEEWAQADPDILMKLAEFENKKELKAPKQSIADTEAAKRTSKLIGKIEENYIQAVGREGLYDTLEQLSDKVAGISNPFGEDAAQLEALGLEAIEAPLKVFNPVGAIPTAKIEMVKSKFAPKYWDLTETKKGKIKALRFINDKALEMGEKLNGLKEIYGNDIPMQELLKLSNEGTQFINMLERYNPSGFKQFGSEGSDNKKELTQEVVAQYLEKANGNPDLAEQMAKQEGYSW